MPLTRGTTLGPYQIDAPLGAGGMGEVQGHRHPAGMRFVQIPVDALSPQALDGLIEEFMTRDGTDKAHSPGAVRPSAVREWTIGIVSTFGSP